jgi:hypothetical protein
MSHTRKVSLILAACWVASVPVTASACSADASAAGVAATIGEGAGADNDARIKRMNSFAVKSHALMRQNLLGMNIALPR